MSELLDSIQEAQSFLADITQAVSYAERALENAENAAGDRDNTDRVQSVREAIDYLVSAQESLPTDHTEVGDVVDASEDAERKIEYAIDTLRSLRDDLEN